MSRWDGIDEFVAVATTGSFSGGAVALAMSTTHMSRAVARLEQRVQAQLFHRTTRSVRLTDTGQVFLERCRRIIMERDEAIALIDERGEPQGELRITCSTAMGERFIAPLVREFSARHPRLSVTIELTNRIIDIVGEGYDLAIRTGQLADSSLIRTRIASRTLHCCAAPDYLLAHGRPRRLSDLASHECLIGTTTTWQFKRQGREEIYRPKGRWRCNSGGAIAEAALAGAGICQLPEFYVLPLIAQGRLEPILEEHAPDAEPIWAVYPQRRHLQPKISALIDLLRHELPSALAQTRS
ncbi:LysR substrate-binding domain-containing protein [Sphingomonas sp. SRS2]|uniref:LysR substrate-binding domain-containing protein n=1 Tax=Sphingomonas sp. SRS2 TaxID=133190 RepID=UPI0006184892|nr:LysR substrate-binding domain-containing protein [Sphingomonas sp. SRS2]KKC24171.1 LysR family transcriptional regulator [Sphingomonas sp. SRS2]